MTGVAGISVAILADDLTGACDTAAAFVSPGLPVEVHLGIPRAGEPGRFVAADLGVRDAPADVGREGLRQAAAAVARTHRVFVKVDSAGRGPIAALVQGAIEGAQARAAIIAPAYPAHGSWVKRGRVYVRGADGYVDLASLEIPTPGGAARVDEQTVWRGVAAVCGAVEQAVARGSRTILVDATSERSLSTIASAWLSLNGVLLAGSGGVAHALAGEVLDELSGPSPAAPDAGPREQPRSGITLVVLGSPAPNTEDQLLALRDRLAANITRVDAGEASPAGDVRAGGVAVFATRSGPSVVRDAGQRAEWVARSALAWARRADRLRGVVLVGGATARSFLDASGADRVEVSGNIGRGIPTGVIRGGSLDGVTLTTKAGRFGGPDVLARVVEHLMHEGEEDAA